jgi:HAD superfamily hydrolase (TIGR01484 family)
VKPIAQIGSDEVRALRVVCFDVDDTITTGGQLDPDAFQAVCELARNGLVLVAATGRPLGFAQVLMQLLPLQAAVGENGAGWFYREESCITGEYAYDEATRDRHRERLADLCARVRDELPHVRTTEDMSLRRCDVAFDVGERVRLPDADVERLLSIIESSGASATMSSIHAHAAFGRHDKATGVRQALSRVFVDELAQNPRDLMFIGDSVNDAAAFSAFPVSAGVANVRDYLDRLPDPPAFVATLRSGQGFREIANELLKRKGDEPWSSRAKSR